MTTTQARIPPTTTLYVVSKVFWSSRSSFETGKIEKGMTLDAGAIVSPFDERSYSIPIYFREKDRGMKPIKAFLDPTKAAIDCQERETEERKGLNPFLYGEKFRDWSHFDIGRLCDWLLDWALNPPEPKKIAPHDWRRWWRDTRPQMKELQVAKVWEALDKIRFYEIEELQP